MPTLLQLSDIQVEFTVRRRLFRSLSVRAVDGVSVSIERGETMALVGESGSGKTTLGRASLKLIDVKSGHIEFDGHDITNYPESKLKWFRKRAQFIFQDPYSSIDPFMNVYQILEEPLLIHGIGEHKDRINDALANVHLTPPGDYMDRYPHMLSGGMRQRVGIARALMLQPEFVVADEPVSMVDASSRAEILDLLRDLQNESQISVLYITHDIATVRHFANKLAVMYLGNIVEIGPPSRIIERPLHPYTQALIESVPEPDPLNRLAERKVVPGEIPSSLDIPPGCQFHTRCPQAIPGLCNILKPQLSEIETDHETACHLYSR